MSRSRSSVIVFAGTVPWFCGGCTVRKSSCRWQNCQHGGAYRVRGGRKWTSRISSLLNLWSENPELFYGVLFQNLKDRGLSTPRLIISDAHSGLVSAIREFFPEASWQRCKCISCGIFLIYVPQKEKKAFAAVLKEIWLAPTAELARKRAYDVIDSMPSAFRKRFRCLEEGLEDSLAFYTSPMLDARERFHLPT